MCERKVVTVNRTAAAVPGLHAPHAGHVARSRHDNQVAMTVHNFANGLIRVHPMGGVRTCRSILVEQRNHAPTEDLRTDLIACSSANVIARTPPAREAASQCHVLLSVHA
jgi:hypothetical protein